MKRNLFIRLFFAVLVTSLSLLLFSYAHSRTSASRSKDEERNCESGKCGSGKHQTEYILWESITRNLLIVKR